MVGEVSWYDVWLPATAKVCPNSNPSPSPSPSPNPSPNPNPNPNPNLTLTLKVCLLNAIALLSAALILRAAAAHR